MVFVLVSTFRRVRRIAITSSVMSVYLPARSNSAPLDGFSLNLIFEDFSNIRRENSIFIKKWQE